MQPVANAPVGQEKGMSDGNIFRTVLLHCLAIIFSPIITFFIFNFWIFTSIGLEPISSNIYSALTAVVALHVALGNFIYRAYFTDTSQQSFDKED